MDTCIPGNRSTVAGYKSLNIWGQSKNSVTDRWSGLLLGIFTLTTNIKYSA